MTTLAMTPSELLRSAAHDPAPPAGLPPALVALWWDARGETARALESIENEENLNAVWVRAYLRRRLGDEEIAAYWYAKAARPMARGSFQVERDAMLAVLLG
jgi:hypothetical protein